MRIYILYIILSLIVSIKTEEIILTSGTPYSLGTISQFEDYIFYIRVKPGDAVEIEVNKLHSSSSPFLYERLDLAVTDLENLHSEGTEVMAYLLSSNTNKFTVLHPVSLPTCTYISIEIYPKSEMELVSILVTVKSSYDFEYDLKSGSSEYLPTLFTSNTYKFYISAEYGKEVYIEFDFDEKYSYYAYNHSITHSITIYEYSSRNSKTELRQTSQYLSFDSHYKLQTSYQVYDSSSTFVAFKIKPDFQMTVVYVNVEVKRHTDGEYDLISGILQTLGELYNSRVYIFYIDAGYKETVDIEFFTSDSYSKFSNDITVYEYKSSSEELGQKRLSLFYIPSKKSYIQSYTVNDYYCSYVAFEISPQYDMKSVNVVATVKSPGNYEFNLTIGNKEYFENLSNGNNYKFYISAKYEQILDIIFLKNDPYFIESQKINIYEYSYRNSEIDLDETETTLYLSYKSSENSYKQTYIVKGSVTNCIAFEIKPYFEMKNVFLTVNVRPPKHSDNDSTNTIIIAISIIAIICIIGILIYFYFTKYKKNNNNLQNLSKEKIEPVCPKD